MPIKVRPDLRTDGARMPGDFVLCPKCFGHGGWNLRLNAYRGTTPEQRHFRASCGQCWGWGWVETASLDATCVHDYVGIAPDQPWRCWHTIQCTKCGATKSYDSSD
jgi:hypothetical protein